MPASALSPRGRSLSPTCQRQRTSAAALAPGRTRTTASSSRTWRNVPAHHGSSRLLPYTATLVSTGLGATSEEEQPSGSVRSIDRVSDDLWHWSLPLRGTYEAIYLIKMCGSTSHYNATPDVGLGGLVPTTPKILSGLPSTDVVFYIFVCAGSQWDSRL